MMIVIITIKIGQKEVNNTLKKKKQISVLDMALFFYLLEQQNYSGFNFEQYIEIMIRNNVNQLYRQCLINIQQQRELEIENNEIQRILNQQNNQKLCINGDKISGFMDSQLIGMNNLAKVKGIEKLDNNAKVKFVAIEDNKTTLMCQSLDNQEFYINKENVFNRYYGETQKELRVERIRCKGLILGLNLPPITHHFHYCRSYTIYVKNIEKIETSEYNNFTTYKKLIKSLKNKIYKYNINNISKTALIQNFLKANKVIKDFPILKDKIKDIVIKESEDYFMAIKPTNNASGYIIYINKDTFSSIKNLKRTYNDNMQLGEMVKGSTYKDILTHELGHELNFEIVKKKYKGNLEKMQNDYSNSITANNIVNKALENIGINTQNKKIKEIKKISNYALEDGSECIGEAICDYYSNGKKANKLSKEIFRIIRGELSE